MPGHEYPNACYQINGLTNVQSPLGYPPPPSYAGPIHQQSSAATINPGFSTTPGLFGYSRPASPMNSNPMYPHSNVSDLSIDTFRLLTPTNL